MAAPWAQYHNDRFGYSIDVPPQFSGHGEPDSHDGQLFTGPAAADLSVWGGYLADGDFTAEEARRIEALQSEGWSLTYKVITPSWGSWSGRKGGRIIYVRAISGCGGAQYAMFAFEYGVAELFKYKPVVGRLVGSLRQAACR